MIEFNDGEIIDTPGFSSIEFDLTINDLPTAFSNFREAAQFCKFRTCKHYQESEKNCEVKRRVTSGLIKEERYQNYLNFLKRLINES